MRTHQVIRVASARLCPLPRSVVSAACATKQRRGNAIVWRRQAFWQEACLLNLCTSVLRQVCTLSSPCLFLQFVFHLRISSAVVSSKRLWFLFRLFILEACLFLHTEEDCSLIIKHWLSKSWKQTIYVLGVPIHPRQETAARLFAYYRHFLSSNPKFFWTL